MPLSINPPPEILRSAIKHWEGEIQNAKRQIASKSFPQHDRACWRYIAKCRRMIRKIHARKFAGKFTV